MRAPTRCPGPFLVLATQNPIESEGVYQLPEAQRDRFLLKVDVVYPDADEELAILQRMSVDPPQSREVLTTERCSPSRPRQTGSSCTTRSRSTPSTSWWPRGCRTATGWRPSSATSSSAPAPAATLGLVAAARALALLRGRDYVLPRDVADVAGDVMAHRLVLSFDAVAEGVDPRHVIAYLLSVVPQPQIAPHDSPTGQADAGAA